MRQQYLLHCLNIIVEDILDVGSTTRDQNERPKKPAEAATAALSELSLQSAPKKLRLTDVLNTALDQKSSLEEYVNLMRTEPTVLAREVNFWYYSRPELVADEKGRIPNTFADDYISAVAFDAINSAVMHAATWDYIHRLMTLLLETPDKRFRAILLQELSNVCVLEFERTQAMFRRSVTTGSGGSKWFKRMPPKQKDKTVPIAMKKDPGSLSVVDPQLYYMLRLCQTDTTWIKAKEWLQNLAELHRFNPLESDKMEEREFESLGDLAVIVTFIRSLSTVAPLPAVKKAKSELFVTRFQDLEEELRHLRTGVDLSEFVIPIGNLLEPGNADSALKILDAFIHEITGGNIGSLYQELVEDCVSKVHRQYEQQKANSKEAKAQYAEHITPSTKATRVQQRRQKEKTQPSRSSVFDITPNATAAAETHSNKKPSPVQPVFKVKKSSHAVFSALFSKSSAARGSISWDAFVAAMTDVGFDVIPNVDPVFTFCPLEKVPVKNDVTIHRPHNSRIQGWKSIQISRKLTRAFGWNDATFTS